MKREIVIDASGGTMGRVAAYAAKQALLGKEIKIVNCSDVLITGNKAAVLERFKRMRRMGGSSLKGPQFPKSPETILKRTIRGMLPHKQARGRDALKRIRCYNAVPAELDKPEKLSLQRDLKVKANKLSKFTKELQ